MPRYGEAVFSPDQVTVGALATFRLQYTVGDMPIEPGGGIKIGLLHPTHFAGMQTDDPAKPNYVSASTSARGSRAKILHRSFGNGIGRKEIVVLVSDARLSKGEGITVIFGDTSQGSPGFRISTISHKHRVMVWVDPDGSRNYVKLGDPAELNCAAGEAARLIALAPSRVVAGRRFDLHVKAVDAFGNPAVSYRGIVHFMSEECDLLPMEYAFQEKDGGARRFAGAAASARLGFNLIAVKDRNSGLACQTNPIEVVAREPEFQMYWGEIHGHSIISDGGATPDEYYRYGRDIEMLDVCAIADHAAPIMRREMGGARSAHPFGAGPLDAWAILKCEADRFHEPGRFVTLHAYEWTSGEDCASDEMDFRHRNVYYCDDEQPFYSHNDLESNTPRKLHSLLRHKRAIVIPHCTSHAAGPARSASGGDWRYHDPEKERLVEIYSKCGNSEFPGCLRPASGVEPGGFVQEALARGYKVGFVAGSDSHCSRPGAEIKGDNLYRRSGLTLFLAEKLTRESIFEAMYARRCYATTGPRIFLDFNINGFCMGEEILASDPEESRVISVRVAGAENLDHIDIVKNGDDLYRHDDSEPFAEFEYVDHTPVSGTDFYYVRVTQSDEEMAWSSPIWVTAQK